MKTTNKTLATTINAYILDCINSEGYVKELNSDKEKLQHLADCFNSEFNYPENKKRYPNTQQRFTEWIMGLPSSFGIDFYNSDIIRISKEWGSLPENATEKQEDKIITNWFNFIAAKTLQLMSKHDIYLNY
jgi:hypothetical protein